MIVVLFRSRLTGAAGEDYRATDAHLAERARTTPGFVDAKAYTAEDGERLTIVRWRDLETLKKWREDPEHRAAQAAGRARWYEHYELEVAEVVRESHFARSVGAEA